MERDIQNFAPRAYAQSVPEMLGDQHRVLLSSLETYLSGEDAPTLLVLGCGGEVLPYSFQYQDGALGESNIERVYAMIRDGSLILVDVTDSEESGLRRSQETLTHCGFFNQERFSCSRAGGDTFVPEGKVQRGACPPSSVIFLQQNLRDPLLIADESVDAIDANLTLHHVTQTQECMLRMYRELYRVLKPGGLLHLGEGNVDMNYSERKICCIGGDFAQILGREVAVQDERDPQYPCHYCIAPGSKASLLQASSPPKAADICVSDEGIVHLRLRNSGAGSGASPTKEGLMEELRKRGYWQSLLMADHVALPLIDPLMDCDRKGLIEGVDRYYETAAERCRRGYGGKREELVRGTVGAIGIERGLAARGIVEYYMGEPLILDALRKAGFQDVRVIRQSEPFYNILAKKPMH
jgi:SAM-dependent methyltransferase